MNALETLRGVRVRRVDAPSPALLALTLGGPDVRTVLLLGLGGSARGVGLCEQRPAGAARGRFASELKRRLESARLIALAAPTPDSTYVTFERGPTRLGLLTGSSSAQPYATLWDEQGAVLAALPSDCPEHVLAARRAVALAAPPLALDLAALQAAGSQLLQSQADALHAERREQLARALAAARSRLERRLAAVEGDLARGDEVSALRRNGSLVLSNLHALRRGAALATVLDTSSDPPKEIALKLDPRLAPTEQAERWFQRARKLERGATIAGARVAETRATLDAVRALAERLTAADPAALEAIATEAAARGVEIAAQPAGEPRARPRTPPKRLPYREFSGTGGRAIRVGRGAADNDELTLHHARPHDLWLHARDDSGAHVVVPLERGEDCPSELLADAATLAAHFSQARGNAGVDVTYVPRRYVRKPRKSPAGLVTVERAKVFRLRLEPARLKRLLAAERGKGV
jgi:predicted ribosome quality control (RQC) complex YloA/Tae2 family protein